MRFSVYCKGQSEAKHNTSREFAAKLVKHGLAFKNGQNAITLRTNEPWSAIKARFRPINGKLPADRLLEPLEHYLPYNFPLPYSLLKNYEVRP